MSESNKEMSRRFTDLFNSDDLSGIGELFTEDFKLHAGAGGLEGVEQMRGFVAAYRNAFPDARSTVDRQIAEADMVVTGWTSRGTHLGAFMGIEPTGRKIQMTGITIERFESGRICEVWVSRDDLGMLQQLGQVPV